MVTQFNLRSIETTNKYENTVEYIRGKSFFSFLEQNCRFNVFIAFAVLSIAFFLQKLLFLRVACNKTPTCLLMRLRVTQWYVHFHEERVINRTRSQCQFKACPSPPGICSTFFSLRKHPFLHAPFVSNSLIL